MNEKDLSDIKKEKYEKEFCTFLTERIKNVGGSLQFQHLIALLSQLDYETKKVVVSTKTELMRFLKAHQNKFKVDGKGIVSVIESVVSDDDFDSGAETNTISRSNPLPPTIEEGIGEINKIYPEFGFIKALEPLETTIYFVASVYGGDKDALLTDFDLQLGDEVYFNAVKGHSDSDAKYRATKVWKQLKSDDGNLQAEKHQINKLDGIGKIKKIFSDVGFISVDEIENDVFFHRNNFVDCNNNDLTKILKIGDCVIFSAVKSQKKDCRAQWEAVRVHKHVKQIKECVKSNNMQNMKKEIIKNQNGKIYPYTGGAVIKFGEKFSQSANGDSSVYFLYGARVTDIAWEYSEGDDVFFDAVKVKSGWKAILVWVGERPDFVLRTCLGDFSEFTDDDDNDELKSHSFSSAYLSESCNSSAKSMNTKSKFRYSNSKQLERNFESHAHFARRDDNEYGKKSRKDNQSSRDSSLSSYSSKELKHCKKQQEGYKKKIPNLKKTKDNIVSKSDRYSDNFNHRGIHDKHKENLTDCNKLLNLNQNEDHENFLNYKSYVKRKKEFNSGSVKNAFLSETTEQLNTDSENKDHLPKSEEKIVSCKASIKTFRNIDAVITNVVCKLAFVKNSELQDDMHFSSSVFYNDGHSVEELQAEDLREIINVGETIKINCFEIVDDFGDFHQQVTMAWRGAEPEIKEMTPHEFIKRKELSVTVDNKFDVDGQKGEVDLPRKFLAAVNDSYPEDIYLSDCQEELASVCSSSDETASHFKASTPDIYKKIESEKDEDSSCDHIRSLPDIIRNKLKNISVRASDSKVDLDQVSNEIIDLILKHHKTGSFDNCQMKVTDSVCSSCLQKNNGTFSNSDIKFQHKEIQTIITGEIVAQRRSF